ncbi:alpha-2,8-polysialyltransferase family protein [Clostridium chauvoei]|nr:alpha-2,8-polysialyltransferase family protein [Clostridium chauvoei]
MYIIPSSQFDERVLANDGTKINERKLTLDNCKLIRNITNDVLNKGVEEIFIFNDTFIMVQILVDRLSKNGATISAIEDGGAAYVDTILPKKKLEAKDYLLLRPVAIPAMYFNFYNKYEEIAVYGTSKKVSNYYVLYPKYVREEFKFKNIIQIKRQYFKEVIDSSTKDKSNINYSYILTLETYSEKAYNSYKEIIKNLRDDNKKIYLKYHPREENFYLNEMIDENIKILPSNKALEEILVGSKGNIIIGSGLSTIYLTVPVISDNKYFAMYKLMNMNVNKKYIEILKDLGVKMPNSILEFTDELNKIKV